MIKQTAAPMMGTGKDLSSLTPFHVLLATISSQLLKEDVRKLKVQLQGHLNKECLDSLQVGADVIGILYQRGLISDKKLAFLKKLLSDCHLQELVELLDDFKKSSVAADTQAKTEILRTRKRLRDLHVVMERQNAEIKNYENDGNELKDHLTEQEVLLDNQKETCFHQDEAVEILIHILNSSLMDRDLIEERAAETKEVIKLQEAELKSLTDAFKNSRFNVQKINQTRVSVFEKHSTDKSKRSLESLIKQKEDKAETLRKLKESDEEITTKLYSERENVRQLNLEILDKTKDLMSIDEEMLDTYKEMRKIRQNLRQNEKNVWDLKTELEDTQDEYEKAESNPISDKTNTVPTWRLQDPGKQKVLDYDDVLEENSYSIGCYGNKLDPLQFHCPSGVAVTRNGVIFVADQGNCRVHCMDQLGYQLREAISISNTYPTSLAVNKKGNVIITDSQIIKVFTSDGKLSHNFLPIYNKSDERPKISALAVDKDGHILAADIVNHRIQTFRIDGHFLGFIGGPAFLQTPSGIAVTKHGDVIVAESDNHQLKIFHHHGKSFSTIGRQGIGKEQFEMPRGLCIDNKGNILVADTMNHRIQVISIDGKYINSFGRLGSGAGCLDTPFAVAVNRRGHVFVADNGNHRITVFT